MPNEPQKDLVLDARELLSRTPEPLEQALRLGVGGILRDSTVLHKKVAEVYTNEHFNLFARAQELLRQLCDEVERLRGYEAEARSQAPRCLTCGVVIASHCTKCMRDWES